MNSNTIEKLLHIEAIKNLRILYGHYLDSNYMDGLETIFSPDAVVQILKEPWRGITEIRTGLEKAVHDYDTDGHGTYPFIHAVTNHWIELTGPATAQGRCYLINFSGGSVKGSDSLLFLGVYSDEYKLIGENWLITRSRMDVVWPERNIQGGIPGVDLVLPD